MHLSSVGNAYIGTECGMAAARGLGEPTHRIRKLGSASPRTGIKGLGSRAGEGTRSKRKVLFGS
jgi:hypothetical protein